MVKGKIEKNSIFIERRSLVSIHFPTKFGKGGTPARLENLNIVRIGDFVRSEDSIVFKYDFFVSLITLTTAIQYRTVTKKKVFILVRSDISIHLMLNTDEYPMI